MRVLFTLLLLCVPVFAQENSFRPSAAPSLTISGCTEQFADLPQLAERLHVAPVQSGKSASVLLSMCDGRGYSLFELINATLDRLDAGVPR